MTKQKVEALYRELRSTIGATPTEMDLFDALETLRKAGEALTDGEEGPREGQVKHDALCNVKKLEAWLSEWEGK